MNRTNALIKIDPPELPYPFHHVRTQQEGVVYEQKASPYQALNLLVS